MASGTFWIKIYLGFLSTFSVLIFSQGQTTSASQGRFSLGAIFDWDDVYTKTGFNYAMSKFSENMKEFRMTALMEDINIKNSFQLVQKICKHMLDGVFVLLGSWAYQSQDIITAFTEKFHMPYITTSVVKQPSLKKSYQVFMRPSITEALLALIKHYRWTDMYYLYDSDAGLMRLQELNELSGSTGPLIKMPNSRRLTHVDNAYEELRKIDQHDFNGGKDVRRIVIDLSSESAYLTLFNQIRQVGMNKKGYTYLIASMDILNLNMDRFTHGGVNITAFQLVDHTDVYVKNFIKQWSKLPPHIWPGAGKKIMVDAALAYDAITVLNQTFLSFIRNNVKAFYNTFRRAEIYNNNTTKGIPCNENSPWMHGETLMANLQQIDIRGLTGRIMFDEDGRRQNFTLHVFKVGLNFGPAKIGEWTQGRGYVQYGVNNTHIDKKEVDEDKPFIVTTIFEKPFLQYKSNHYELEDNEKYEGYSVDLLKAVAERIGFKYTIQPTKGNEYGVKNKNGSWNGMMADLIEKRADLAVAPLTITAEREIEVDFSKPFMNSGISIMIKTPEIQRPGVFSFMKPFSITLWICIVVGYIVVSLGMFVVSRFSPAEWNRKRLRLDRGRVNKFTLQSSLWFTMGALMLQGSDTCPRSAAGRIIGGTWWLVVLIAISSYTANLAAFLTIDKLLTPIENADDLADQTEIAYGILDSGSTKAFFKESNVTTYHKMWNYMNSNKEVMVKSTEDGIVRVRESKGKYAFLLESVYNEYFNQKEPCNTMQVGPPLSVKGYGIATPKNSTLRNAISITVLQLIEDGSLIKMKKTWWVDKGECGVQEQHQGSKKKSLSLSNIAGGFFILISGLVLAIIVAVVEFQRTKSQGKREGFFLLGTEIPISMTSSYAECANENGQNQHNSCALTTCEPVTPLKSILSNNSAASAQNNETQQNNHNDKINSAHRMNATSLL